MSTIEDKRQWPGFWIHDSLIDTYGQELGVYGIALYVYLARRSKGGQSFPSIRRMAQDLNCGTSKIQGLLRQLQRLALITVEHRTSADGDADSNRYTILTPPVSPGDTGVSHGDTPTPCTDTGVYLTEIHGGVSPGNTEGLRSKTKIKTEDPPFIYPPAERSEHDLAQAYRNVLGTSSLLQDSATLIASGTTQSPTAKKRAPSSLKQQAIPFPPDFVLTPTMHAWADVHAAHVDRHFQTAQFQDHALARNLLYLDWSAAWRTWMRNAAKWQAERTPPPVEGTMAKRRPLKLVL